MNNGFKSFWKGGCKSPRRVQDSGSGHCSSISFLLLFVCFVWFLCSFFWCWALGVRCWFLLLLQITTIHNRHSVNRRTTLGWQNHHSDHVRRPVVSEHRLRPRMMQSNWTRSPKSRPKGKLAEDELSSWPIFFFFFFSFLSLSFLLSLSSLLLQITTTHIPNLREHYQSALQTSLTWQSDCKSTTQRVCRPLGFA